MIRGHPASLGEAVLQRVLRIARWPNLLGALLHEVVCAPAITVVTSPTVEELMALALQLTLP